MDPLARVGQPAPDFELPDLQARPHRLAGRRGRVVLLNFWSADCPHSTRLDGLLQSLRSEWGERVELWSIAPNRNERPEQLARAAAGRGVKPLLLDLDQTATEAYGATVTPHLFLIDAQGTLRYVGAPDDVRFGQPTPTRSYLAEAVAALLAGRDPPLTKTPAYGCAIVRAEG
jgi:peroxiredoxin